MMSMLTLSTLEERSTATLVITVKARTSYKTKKSKTTYPRNTL